MTPEQRKRWKELEVSRRLPVGWAAHPDDCETLTIKGVDWALPSRGLRVVPVFQDGRAVLSMAGADQWPEARRLAELARQIKREHLCPRCGRATAATVDADGKGPGLDALETAATLARHVLTAQYDLNDEELSELLSFDCPRTPDWCTQLVRWSAGLDTKRAPAPASRRSPRRWWRFWRRRT